MFSRPRLRARRIVSSSIARWTSRMSSRPPGPIQSARAACSTRCQDRSRGFARRAVARGSRAARAGDERGAGARARSAASTGTLTDVGATRRQCREATLRPAGRRGERRDEPPMGDGIARNASRAAGAWRIRGATRGVRPSRGYAALMPVDFEAERLLDDLHDCVSAPSASPCCTTSSTGHRAAADGRLVSLAVGRSAACAPRSVLPSSPPTSACRGEHELAHRLARLGATAADGGLDCGVRVRSTCASSAARG